MNVKFRQRKRERVLQREMKEEEAMEVKEFIFIFIY